MTLAFAPGMFISPGGEFGTIAPTVLIIIYYWPAASIWAKSAVGPLMITFAISLMLLFWLDKKQAEGERTSI
jgi:hypothetical protein